MTRFNSLQRLATEVNNTDWEFHQGWYSLTNPQKGVWVLHHNHYGNTAVEVVQDSSKEYMTSTALRYALLSILVERLAMEKYHEKHERGTA